MDQDSFVAACRREGFGDVEEKTGQPGFTSKLHTHPFAVRAMVLTGEFSLTRNGATEVFRPGGTFVMDAGCEHAEAFGPDGSKYLVARKHAAT